MTKKDTILWAQTYYHYPEVSLMTQDRKRFLINREIRSYRGAWLIVQELAVLKHSPVPESMPRLTLTRLPPFHWSVNFQFGFHAPTPAIFGPTVNCGEVATRAEARASAQKAVDRILAIILHQPGPPLPE